MRWDAHTHSTFSDGRSTPREMARQALRLGLDTLGFSDHAYAPDDAGWCTPPERMEAYRREIRALSAEYAGQIRLLLGVEADLAAPVVPGEYDYVIAASHYVEKDGLRFSADESEPAMVGAVETAFSGDYAAWARGYFQSVAKLSDLPKVDVVAHIDLAAKYNEGGRWFDEADPAYLRAAEDAIDAFSGRGVVFEMNSGAVSRGYRKTPYPGREILRILRRRGARITFSSDAHDAEFLTFKFDQMAQIARECGFKVAYAPGHTGQFDREIPIK